jgi:peptidoglycan/LPS O-acetylase OafA/YrhL
VTLFFVLSGYLISGLLLGELQRSGRIDLWRFLCRRSVRLLPALLVFLLALPILMWMLADPSLGRYPREAVADLDHSSEQ